MEVKIGVQHAPRELVVDTTESADDVEKNLSAAVASGEPFAITDTRGRRILVPSAGIAYVEIGGGVSGQVGFRS
jgi:Protein of unknown function (DUF3107)